nr:hypothetical protein [uncultured Carboxylicivirga sp.]
MPKLKSTFIISTFLFLAVLKANSQPQSIYSKEIVYTYNYTITKDGVTQAGIVYLGCTGKFDERTKQYGVTWTKNINFLLDKHKTSGTGEDSICIFTHPPRFDEFSILEFTPFPYVKYPLTEGTSWIWNLSPGIFWANKNNLVEDDDNFKYSYQIGKKSSGHFLFSPSLINYYVINGVTQHPKLDSSFTGYFNQTYGFIYCKFNNIDHSTITLNLKETCSYDELKNRSMFTIPLF